jgi:FkbM family methyltransferase
LPWDCTINACSGEGIGRSIATQGIYDLPLTEAILRLTDPGETSLDAGANIGYMTLLLAWCAGPGGRVISFEPNPAVRRMLQNNVASWETLSIAPIEILSSALSDRDGEGFLGFPEGYDSNWGVASLEAPAGNLAVKLSRLDSIASESVGVMKVDVEGHEASVFQGAENLLSSKRIRDILFEEHETYPARSHKLLLDHGYKIFKLTRSVFRPLLLAADAPARQSYLPSNFLATADPSRAQARFNAGGWFSLSSSRKIKRREVNGVPETIR